MCLSCFFVVVLCVMSLRNSFVSLRSRLVSFCGCFVPLCSCFFCLFVAVLRLFEAVLCLCTCLCIFDILQQTCSFTYQTDFEDKLSLQLHLRVTASVMSVTASWGRLHGSWTVVSIDATVLKSLK